MFSWHEMVIEYSLKKDQLFDTRDLKIYNLMLTQNFKTFGIYLFRQRLFGIFMSFCSVTGLTLESFRETVFRKVLGA